MQHSTSSTGRKDVGHGVVNHHRRWCIYLLVTRNRFFLYPQATPAGALAGVDGKEICPRSFYTL